MTFQPFYKYMTESDNFLLRLKPMLTLNKTYIYLSIRKPTEFLLKPVQN